MHGKKKSLYFYRHTGKRGLRVLERTQGLITQRTTLLLRILERIPSLRTLKRTPSLRTLERALSLRTLKKTLSLRSLRRTLSLRILKRTLSMKILKRTLSSTKDCNFLGMVYDRVGDADKFSYKN